MKPYGGDPFELFSSALERKSETDEKRALTLVKDKIRAAYDSYNERMKDESLYVLPPNDELSRVKDPLLGMFSSQCALVKKIRKWYFDNNSRSYYKLCPYCTISEANTTEHILPKEKFPEYATHAFNLIPACSHCNSLKGEEILNENNKRFTINYYTDKIPDVRYLRVKIEYDNQTQIRIKFYLENTKGIQDDLFNLLRRHYTKFNLIERFENKAIQELPCLVNCFLAEQIRCEVDYERVAEIMKKKNEWDVSVLGINHWKIALYFDVIASPSFKKYILNRC